jgi:voltage-gated potassium channel
MKFLTAQLLYFLKSPPGRRNLKELFRLGFFLFLLMLLFSVVFHALMAMEGQKHSWFAGFYWTLVTMSTLGYGDIVFTSELGRLFAMLVIFSGMVSLLVVLPFTFIRFFYEPWMEAHAVARAPKKVGEDCAHHVILTNYDPVTNTLINKLTQYGYPYVLLVKELSEALALHDKGLRVVHGELDHPQTYRNVLLERAALVASTANDFANSNIAFTVRELSETIPIITTANVAASVDILELAGSTHVLQLGEMMGQSLARRTIGGDARAHVIGRFEQLLIAEATVAGTPLVGKSLAESNLRELSGLNVVGVWERGRYESAGPSTRITAHTVLVLAGSYEQFRTYNELFCIYHVASAPVVIIGGGRVGRATGRALEKRQMDYRIVEERPERIRNPEKYVLGSAAELETLERAGIREAPAAIITTHSDDINTYLTIYCRRLRPDIQIISRSTLERNVSTMHRAGADFVMSYSSMGANAIFNLLKRSDILMVAEGLNIFRVKVPPQLAGKTIAQSLVRQITGCSIIAIKTAAEFQVNPPPSARLNVNAEIVLIGTVEDENRFLVRFVNETKA